MKQIRLEIPKKPKMFLFEESNLMMTEKNIKAFCKDYAFTYILDYINAKVRFMDKQQ